MVLALFAMADIARAEVRELQNDITVTGMDQSDLVTFLQNLRDVVNELVDDHATHETMLDDLHDKLLFASANMEMIATVLDGAGGLSLSSVSTSLVGAGPTASSAGALTNSTDLTLIGN